MAKICRECLKKHDDSAKFCTDCGAGLEYIPEQDSVNGETAEPEENGSTFSETFVNTDAENECFPNDDTAIGNTYSENETAESNENNIIPPQPEHENENGKTDSEEKGGHTDVRQKEHGKKRISPPRVLAAAFLAVFLFANYVLLVAVSGVFGLCISDVANVRIGKGADSFVISDLEKALEDTFNDDLENLVDDVAKGKVVDITANGEEYRLTVPEETSSFLRRVVYESDEFFDEFENGIEDVLEDASKAVGAVGAYVLVTTLFTFVTLVICLGKKRRTLALPGIVLMLVGIASLVLSMIAAFAPTMFDSRLVVFFYSFDGVVISTLITSAAMSVVGMFLSAIGITGKKE